MKPKTRTRQLSPARTRRQDRYNLRLSALALALMAGTAQAGVIIDQKPLSIATPPPPNILLMLDDSGSMQFPYMPDTVPTFSDSNSRARYFTYTLNTLWYNPLITYKPWANADGTLMPNADYSGNVSAHHSLLNPSSSTWTNSYRNLDEFQNMGWTAYAPASWRNLSTQEQFFHAKINPNGSDTSISNFKAYVFNAGETPTAKRCAPGAVRDAFTSCTPVSSFSWTLLDGAVINRTVAEERQNYANWYHYYRTRNKMAKASLTHAFSSLGPDFRVGFYTINKDGDQRNIPTTGTFAIGDSNRDIWFDTVINQSPLPRGTPLLTALDRAGKYYSQIGNAGPWGPPLANGQHLSCRRSYTILTTDGYWNGTEPDNITNADDVDGSLITHANGTQMYKYVPKPPFTDGYTRTLADVAMEYWKKDLRPDLPNNVPTLTSNPDNPEQDGAFWQHMTTFTISIGVQGTIDPITDWDALKAGTKAWPNPRGTDQAAKIDDLFHAAVNSRGKFVVASNPEEFKNSLIDALSAISVVPGTGVALAASSASAGPGVRLFQATFTSGEWTGDIIGHATDPASGAIVTSPAPWRASSQLPAWKDRNIKVNVDGTLRDFKYDNLSSTQRLKLNNDTHLVDYLRGDKSREAENNNAGTNGYRKRASILGDFVNSQPVYVGTPSYDPTSTRTKMVYVGGNDGMLHGFNADTGKEVFAFIPSAAIMEGLADLAVKPFNHRYYVDGELLAHDINTGSGWRTVLVGSMGRGGKAIFALDVTNPDDISLLWEKSQADIPQIGNILGKPQIGKVADGEWRVFVGSGPNTASDQAHLLMIDLATGNVTTVNTDSATNNGLMEVTLADKNRDGLVDTVYAGDLRGRMWRFEDLIASPTASRLFTATAGGTAQPITAAPTLGRHPDTGDVWVFFGTGRYLNQGDLTDKSLQSLYGLIDDGTAITGRSSLLQRKITSSSDIETGSAADIQVANKRGWYMDLQVEGGPAEGERIIDKATLRGSVLWTNTNIPDGTDPCATTGRGYTMYMSAFSGAKTESPQVDLNGDGEFGEADAQSRLTPTPGVPHGFPLIEPAFDPDSDGSDPADGDRQCPPGSAAANIVDSEGNVITICIAGRKVEARPSSWRELF